MTEDNENPNKKLFEDLEFMKTVVDKPKQDGNKQSYDSTPWLPEKFQNTEDKKKLNKKRLKTSWEAGGGKSKNVDENSRTYDNKHRGNDEKEFEKSSNYPEKTNKNYKSRNASHENVDYGNRKPKDFHKSDNKNINKSGNWKYDKSSKFKNRRQRSYEHRDFKEEEIGPEQLKTSWERKTPKYLKSANSKEIDDEDQTLSMAEDQTPKETRHQRYKPSRWDNERNSKEIRNQYGYKNPRPEMTDYRTKFRKPWGENRFKSNDRDWRWNKNYNSNRSNQDGYNEGDDEPQKHWVSNETKFQNRNWRNREQSPSENRFRRYKGSMIKRYSDQPEHLNTRFKRDSEEKGFEGYKHQGQRRTFQNKRYTSGYSKHTDKEDNKFERNFEENHNIDDMELKDKKINKNFQKKKSMSEYSKHTDKENNMPERDSDEQNNFDKDEFKDQEINKNFQKKKSVSGYFKHKDKETNKPESDSEEKNHFDGKEFKKQEMNKNFQKKKSMSGYSRHRDEDFNKGERDFEERNSFEGKEFQDRKPERKFPSRKSTPDNSKHKDKENNNDPKRSMPVVKRREWGAPKTKWGIGPQLKFPLKDIYCLPTYKRPCYNKKQCIKELLYLQQRHTSTPKCPDIKYSFFIGNDGTVYECRGWHTRPGLPKQFEKNNKRSLFIALAGDYNKYNTPDAVINARDYVIEYGLRHKMIDKDYSLHSAVDHGEKAGSEVDYNTWGSDRGDRDQQSQDQESEDQQTQDQETEDQDQETQHHGTGDQETEDQETEDQETQHHDREDEENVDEENEDEELGSKEPGWKDEGEVDDLSTFSDWESYTSSWDLSEGDLNASDFNKNELSGVE